MLTAVAVQRQRSRTKQWPGGLYAVLSRETAHRPKKVTILNPVSAAVAGLSRETAPKRIGLVERNTICRYSAPRQHENGSRRQHRRRSMTYILSLCPHDQTTDSGSLAFYTKKHIVHSSHPRPRRASPNTRVRPHYSTRFTVATARCGTQYVFAGLHTLVFARERHISPPFPLLLPLRCGRPTLLKYSPSA